MLWRSLANGGGAVAELTMTITMRWPLVAVDSEFGTIAVAAFAVVFSIASSSLLSPSRSQSQSRRGYGRSY